MKKAILILTILFTSLSGYCQNTVKDAQGNYTAIKRAGNDSSNAKLTGAKYTDANKKEYPVYESTKGKLFVMKISKNNISYRLYLKL